jgi:hypothetical protein
MTRNKKRQTKLEQLERLSEAAGSIAQDLFEACMDRGQNPQHCAEYRAAEAKVDKLDRLIADERALSGW